MKWNITNRTSGVRKFAAGDRYLMLAGGEAERGVELSKDEADALIATNEFHVVGIKDAAAEMKPAPVQRAAAEDRPAKAT